MSTDAAGEQIEFSEVGAPDGPPSLPEIPPVTPPPGNVPGRRPRGVPGAGAIPVGAVGSMGIPFQNGQTPQGPPIVRDAGPPTTMPGPPTSAPFTIPSQTATTAAGGASGAEVAVNAALAPEAEKRLGAVVDRMISQAEDRLAKAGENTAKGILEQFAAHGGKRFVEKMSDNVAMLVIAALKPNQMRRILITASACLFLGGVGAGAFAAISLMRPSTAPTAAAALLADPHMAQSVGSLVRDNDASTIMRIAVCDPALGLLRKRARNGRVLCAGADTARFGWAIAP